MIKKVAIGTPDNVSLSVEGDGLRKVKGVEETSVYVSLELYKRESMNLGSRPSCAWMDTVESRSVDDGIARTVDGALAGKEHTRLRVEQEEKN